MSIDMSQFYQVFFDEATEHLTSMESLLLELDIAAPDSEQLNAIFRAAHSIKGGGSTFGFTDMADVTHILETLLDRIRKNELALTRDMVDIFLQTGDVLRGLLVAHQSGGVAETGPSKEISEKLERLAAGGSPHRGGADTGGVIPVQQKFRDGLPTGVLHTGAAEQPEQTSAKEYKPANSGQGTSRARDESALTIEPQQPSTANLSQDAPEYVERAYGLFAETDLGENPSRRVGSHEDTLSQSAQSGLDANGYGFFVEPEVIKAGLENAQGYGFFTTIEHQAPPSVAELTPRDDDVSGRRAADKKAATPEGESTIRVGVGKVDSLVNLVGELVITQAMLAESASALDPALHELLFSGLAQLEHNTRDLQETVMSVRMMPIGHSFSRFQRVVRDTAAKLDKKVQLKLVGESTELDKGLIEKINDPLNHLVRNSIDHGIEFPEERIAKGKDPQGTITLRAAHQGGSIIIQVSDDGAGLNRDRILAKAREKGMPVSDSMSDADVWQMIFAPGFSTADVVTDISGRGVGMDVVKKNIDSIGGRIDITSVRGQGSTMTLRLPLTLAILDGLSIAVGDQLYIVPLGFISESLQPNPDDIKEISGQGEVVHLRGEYLPLIALHKLFNVQPKFTNPAEGILVLMEADGKKIALFVDELLGQHQVVIKSLETNYRKVPGVSGATIMGDGRVAMIIDVGSLVKLTQRG